MVWWCWLALGLAQESEADGEAADETETADETDETEAADDADEADEAEAADEAERADETDADSPSSVDPAPPPVLVIPPYNLDAGLTNLETAGTEPSSTDEAKLAEDALARLDGIDWEGPTSMVRGRWYVKPVFTFEELRKDGEAATAVRAGGAVGRMWFTTGALPVQGGADLGVHVSAPIGRAVGYRIHGHGLVGPWLGPVGLRVGPTVRADRTRWTLDGTEQLLDDAVLVGSRTVLALDAGPIAPYISMEPAWRVSGTRTSPTDAPVLPVLGTETRYSGGFTVQAALLLLGVHVHRTETALGGIMAVGASIAIRPPSNTKRGDT